MAQNFLVGTPKVCRFKFVTQNESQSTGDEISESFDIFRRFVAFICDLMIKVSNIKEIPPILKIDIKFLFKI